MRTNIGFLNEEEKSVELIIDEVCMILSKCNRDNQLVLYNLIMSMGDSAHKAVEVFARFNTLVRNKNDAES